MLGQLSRRIPRGLLLGVAGTLPVATAALAGNSFISGPSYDHVGTAYYYLTFQWSYNNPGDVFEWHELFSAIDGNAYNDTGYGSSGNPVTWTV